MGTERPEETLSSGSRPRTAESNNTFHETLQATKEKRNLNYEIIYYKNQFYII